MQDTLYEDVHSIVSQFPDWFSLFYELPWCNNEHTPPLHCPPLSPTFQRVTSFTCKEDTMATQRRTPRKGRVVENEPDEEAVKLINPSRNIKNPGKRVSFHESCCYALAVVAVVGVLTCFRPSPPIDEELLRVPTGGDEDEIQCEFCFGLSYFTMF